VDSSLAPMRNVACNHGNDRIGVSAVIPVRLNDQVPLDLPWRAINAFSERISRHY
jgi:hypothetical protein